MQKKDLTLKKTLEIFLHDSLSESNASKVREAHRTAAEILHNVKGSENKIFKYYFEHCEICLQTKSTQQKLCAKFTQMQ